MWLSKIFKRRAQSISSISVHTGTGFLSLATWFMVPELLDVLGVHANVRGRAKDKLGWAKSCLKNPWPICCAVLKSTIEKSINSSPSPTHSSKDHRAGPYVLPTLFWTKYNQVRFNFNHYVNRFINGHEISHSWTTHSFSDNNLSLYLNNVSHLNYKPITLCLHRSRNTIEFNVFIWNIITGIVMHK